MKRNSFRGLIPLTLSILVLGYSTNLEQVWADQKKVTLIRTPNDGIQPQAVVDAVLDHATPN